MTFIEEALTMEAGPARVKFKTICFQIKNNFLKNIHYIKRNKFVLFFQYIQEYKKNVQTIC